MQRLLCILLLWSVPALASRRDAPAPDPKASPELLLQGIAGDEFLVRQDLVGEAAARFHFVEPGTVLGDLAVAKAPWKDVVARLAREERLAQAAAEPLARALVRRKAFLLHFNEAPRAEIEADLETAIRASQGALVTVACAAGYFRYDGRVNRAAQWIALNERLAPDVPVLPKRLVELAPVEPWADESLLLAIERSPKLVVDAVLAGGQYGYPALLPSYDAALAELHPERSPAELARAVQVANAKLSALLGAGLAEDAVAAFQALPPAVSEGVLSHSPPARVRYGNVETSEGGPQLALDLGAAFLLTGDRETAETLLHRGAGRTNRPGSLDAPRWAELLEAALKPERDPFEVLLHGVDGLLWTRVALIASRDYPEFTARFLGGYARASAPTEREGDEAPQPRRAMAAKKAFDARVAAVVEKLGASEMQPAPAPADPLAGKIHELLTTPARQPCTERPSSAPGAGSGWTALHVEAPAGFFFIGAAKKDRDAVVIYASQRLDPTGEVSRGGYWFARSLDGGETWSRPGYLGLREMRPYVISPGAAPRLEGETLVLPAAIREIDESRIRFPPIHLPTKREGGPIELACPLREIEKDSDGDGLSDLVEERLVTDPHAADTDGDGILDAQDPLPQVPAKGKPSMRGVLLFRALTEGPPQAGIIVGPFESAVGPRELADDAGTTFLATDRTSLTALSSARRTIVLTREEAALASEKFGAFYPRRAPFVATNHAGTLAYVEWSTGWSGGEYLLRKRSDGWHVEILSTWIT